MKMQVDAPSELVLRNNELTNPPGQRPTGFGDEHGMRSRITELKLAIASYCIGVVTFELAPKGNKVLLTVIHRSLPDRATMLRVGPGWHLQLDVLVARATGEEPEPIWDGWSRLRRNTRSVC
jgi:hypothetical protein